MGGEKIKLVLTDHVKVERLTFYFHNRSLGIENSLKKINFTTILEGTENKAIFYRPYIKEKIYTFYLHASFLGQKINDFQLLFGGREN